MNLQCENNDACDQPPGYQPSQFRQPPAAGAAQSKKSVELTKKAIEINSKEQALNNRENAIDKRESNLNRNELNIEFSVKFAFISEAASKLSGEQIKAMGKDYWLTLINRIKEIKELDGGNSWRVSQIYSALQLYSEFYDEVCNMAKHGFQIWESEIKIVLDKTCYRTTLKDALNTYIAQHKVGERVDEYVKCVSLLEG